ncbi:hypothetical protein ACFXTO_031165 [Malus domestica]
MIYKNPTDAKTRLATEETVKTSKVYTFDITKADAIFDQLLLAKIIKLRLGHNIPKAEELKGKTYCKYHNSTKHTMNNCVVFRDDIQSWINKGKLKFPEKQMVVDVDPFLSATVGMVDAYLPKSKGKGKFSGPAVVESISDSSAEETDGLMVLCSNCRASVVLTEPKERPTSRQPYKSAVTPPKEPWRRPVPESVR